MAGILSLPQEDTGSALGQALAGGFQQGFQGGLEKQYAEAQRLRKASSLRDALAKAEATYGDPNLSPEQKQVSLYRDLAEHPEVAQALGGQIPNVTKASQPKAPKQPPIQERPISPEQAAAIKAAKEIPGYDQLDEVGKYDALVDKGVSPALAKTSAELTGSKLGRESTKFDKSFADQKDFIEDTTNSYSAFESQTKPRLLGLQRLSENDLISPTANAFLETLGIPLGALDDPSSELYQKLSQDLLKGLPESYGNRILKVEVDNFLKTIPTLANSPNGRRMIASNLLKLGEMKEVYYKEMRKLQKDSLDNNKPLPKDFQQRVLDNVLPQIGKINQEFMAMSDVTDVPEGTIPMFNPQGGISFIPKEQEQEALQNGGKRIW